VRIIDNEKQWLHDVKKQERRTYHTYTSDSRSRSEGGEIMISLEIVIINKMSLDQNFRLVVIYIAQRR
jgi:hypothetical protein